MSVNDSAFQKAQKYELLDPDVRLMLQVRNGNAAAFEKLVEKYQNRLISVLEHIVPNRDQAEDLTQEVFMRVYRARERYVPGAKFSTWLFTIDLELDDKRFACQGPTESIPGNRIRKHQLL